RAGRRRYNPGPGLFCKVLKSSIRDPIEEWKLKKDRELLNSERRTGIRVLQVGIYNRMPFRVSTALRTFSKCLEPLIAKVRKRCCSKIFVYVDDILILNQDLTILLFEMQQLDQPHVDSRVLGLAAQYYNNDNVNDNILKERNTEVTKTSDKTSQDIETHRNN
ncbi:MAG: hypothetical protein EZS28_049631, partial [Streblomastix strix]